MRSIPIFAVVLLNILLVACGADGGSSFNPVRDSAETSATISFAPGASQIVIEERGPDATGSTLAICKFTLATIESRLSYRLLDAQNLELGTSRFTYARPLVPAASVDGVPQRLFSVWTQAPVVQQGGTLVLELEISADRLLFRINCTE